MGICKEEFGRRYVERFQALHGVGLEDGTKLDQYRALASLVKEELAADWVKSTSHMTKKAGILLRHGVLASGFWHINLTYRGLRETIREGLQKLGIDLREIGGDGKRGTLAAGVWAGWVHAFWIPWPQWDSQGMAAVFVINTGFSARRLWTAFRWNWRTGG